MLILGAFFVLFLGSAVAFVLGEGPRSGLKYGMTAHHDLHYCLGGKILHKGSPLPDHCVLDFPIRLLLSPTPSSINYPTPPLNLPQTRSRASTIQYLPLLIPPTLY